MGVVMSDFKKALLENRLARNDQMEIKTSLSFLTNVNGWRKGCVHVVLGTTSSGKSTLVRSIIHDILANNDKVNVSLFLSEETSDDYSLELYRAFRNLNYQDRVNFYSEQDTLDLNKSRALLEEAFSDNSEVIIYDNLTTSMVYGEKYEGQSECAIKLKTATKKSNKAFVAIAHTNNVIKNSRDLIDSGSVRGSKTISNIAEFFFINHQISCDDNLFNFIQIEKHRNQRPENKFFRLNYDNKKSIFKNCTPVSFNDFKELWKLRDKL